MSFNEEYKKKVYTRGGDKPEVAITAWNEL